MGSRLRAALPVWGSERRPLGPGAVCAESRVVRALAAISLGMLRWATSVINDATNTMLQVWGVGITQNIDAAATELYLNYRNFSAAITASIAGVAVRLRLTTSTLASAARM